jgi:hypothetical protein
MLALTLFKPIALAWAAATSAVSGVNSTSTCKKKAKLEDFALRISLFHLHHIAFINAF